MFRIKFAFPLSLAVALFAGACDGDETINVPPSPRLSLEGTVELTDDDDNKLLFALIDQEVIADASESFDVQDEEFSLAFEFTRPEGSSAELTVGQDGDSATLTPDVAGEYSITVTATDLIEQSQERTLVFTARDNQGPTASAKAEDVAILGRPTQIDGTGSKDADDGFELDDDLQFKWRLVAPDGSDADELLASKTAPMAQFKPATVGDYQAFLIVSDQFADSEEVSVTVPVRDNRAPIADVDRAVAGSVGAPVKLDGSGSVDPDGDDLTIAWSLFAPDGANITDELVDADTLEPSFVPSLAGTYRAVLVITDPFGDPSEDAVLIDVTPAD